MSTPGTQGKERGKESGPFRRCVVICRLQGRTETALVSLQTVLSSIPLARLLLLLFSLGFLVESQGFLQDGVSAADAPSRGVCSAGPCLTAFSGGVSWLTMSNGYMNAEASNQRENYMAFIVHISLKKLGWFFFSFFFWHSNIIIQMRQASFYCSPFPFTATHAPCSHNLCFTLHRYFPILQFFSLLWDLIFSVSFSLCLLFPYNASH